MSPIRQFRPVRGVEPGRHAGPSAAPVRALGIEPPAFLIVLDLISLILAFCVAYLAAPALKDPLLSRMAGFDGLIAVLSPQTGEYRPVGEMMWMLLLMSIVALVVTQALGGYRSLIAQSRTRLLLLGLAAPMSGLSTIAVVLLATRSQTWSRLFIFLFALFAALALSSSRLLLRSYRSRRIASGFYARSVILAGPTRALEWLSAHVIDNTSRAEYDLVGHLRISPAQPPVHYRTESGSMTLPCLGDVGQLPTLLVHRPVHEVIAVQGAGPGEWLRAVVETCDYFRVTLRIVPEALVFGELRDLQLIYHSDPLRLPEIVLRPRNLDSTALFFKRVIDMLLSGALLLLLSPLFAIIAILIKLTTPKIPVFYPWKVVGQNGRAFTGYKFSTMVENAEAQRAGLQELNEMQGPVFKIRKDPRVTRLGTYLRKYSLNELPQLWSVLKGDMSLVGPRPAFPHELERYELWHKRKLTVRPGMTCLWQIRGRNTIAKFDDWVRMDLEYIDNWSLWLDVKILMRTAWAVVAGTGS